MKKIYFLIATIFILSACDMGMEGGKDLAGTWEMKKSDTTLSITFRENGTGVYYGYNTENFTYSCKKGSFYNEYDYHVNNTNDTVTHEYYFSLDKKKLYIREKNTSYVIFGAYDKK